jgi:hypothetical protein
MKYTIDCSEEDRRMYEAMMEEGECLLEAFEYQGEVVRELEFVEIESLAGSEVFV